MTAEAARSSASAAGRAGAEAATRAAILGAGAFCALLLAAPGRTVTTRYLNDLFVFLDGAHRIASGQTPSVDFETALGPLAFYAPAAGLALTGGLGGAMPAAMALATLALAAAAAAILPGRMRPAIALPLAALLILVAAAPVNTGESAADLSFAMFYNRLGWAALGVVFALRLPRRDGLRDGWATAVAGGALVVAMAFTKISYGLVGAGFLALLAVDPGRRSIALRTLVVAAAAGGAGALAWGGAAAHLADLRAAAAVSGGPPDAGALLESAVLNVPDLVLFGLLTAMLLASGPRRTDALFLCFCAGSGLLLIGQNFQLTGILTLAAGGAVAAEALARRAEAAGGAGLAAAGAGAPLLLAAALTPAIAHGAAALALHAGLAAANYGDRVALPRFEGVRLARLWTEGFHPFFTGYDATLADGAAALSALGVEGPVVTLDFVNPFPAGLGLPPARGDSPWRHWGRTLDAAHLPPADRLFGDAVAVMDPKRPVEIWTADGLRRAYAADLAARFELALETPAWRVYRARAAPRRTSSAISAPSTSSTAQP